MNVPDQPTRLLFLCTQNRLRSPTAESLFKGSALYVARSAGTGFGAHTVVTADHIGWADIIFCMEPVHAAYLKSRFAKALREKRVICLEIPDEYGFMDPALITILREKLAAHIDLPDD